MYVFQKPLHIIWGGVVFVVAVMLSIVCVQLATGAQASASQTGGYPYADKPCVHAPYGTSGSGAGWCANYDWGDRRNDTSAANVLSPHGYYYRNCTDYAAWKLDTQGIAAAKYKGLGDAKTWATRAATKGLRVDATPAAGSVGVRTTGTYGHVAYVEQVYPDGTLRVSQYNKQATGTYSEQTGTAAALGFTRFVHFEDMLPPAVPMHVTPVVLPVEAPLEMPAETSALVPVTVPVSESVSVPAAAMPESRLPAATLTATASAQSDEVLATPPPAVTLASVSTSVPAPVDDPPSPLPPAPVSLPDATLPLAEVPISGVTPAPVPDLPRTASVMLRSPHPVPVQWWQDGGGPPPFTVATAELPPGSLAVYAPLIALAVLLVWQETRWGTVKMFTAALFASRHTRTT